MLPSYICENSRLTARTQAPKGSSLLGLGSKLIAKATSGLRTGGSDGRLFHHHDLVEIESAWIEDREADSGAHCFDDRVPDRYDFGAPSVAPIKPFHKNQCAGTRLPSPSYRDREIPTRRRRNRAQHSWTYFSKRAELKLEREMVLPSVDANGKASP